MAERSSRIDPLTNRLAAKIAATAVGEDALLDALGGQASVREFEGASKSIEKYVDEQLEPGETAKGQDLIYKGMGLQCLLRQAEIIRKDFEEIGHQLVALLKKDDILVEFICAPVKSFESAALKVDVDYAGDCCQLSDAVRGTLKIISPLGENALQTVYAALDKIVRAHEILGARNARFTFFKDRYQRPVVTPTGKYRDWFFLLRIMDWTCELQVNLPMALEIKEGEQHTEYEMERLGKNKLLEASMKGNAKLVKLMIKAGASVDSKDLHGHTPLHFASRLGDAEMTEALLSRGADPLAVDTSGRTPLHHACVMRHLSVSQMLLKAMETPTQISKISELSEVAKNSLQTAGVISRLRFEAEDIPERIASLLQQTLAGEDRQLYAAASSGNAVVCRALVQKGVRECNETLHAGMCSSATLLDAAVHSGSVSSVLSMEGLGCGFLYNACHADTQAAAENYATMNKARQLMALVSACEMVERENPEFQSNFVKPSPLDLPKLLERAAAHGADQVIDALAKRNVKFAEDEETLKFAGAALCEASGRGHVDQVNQLLQARAPPGGQSLAGYSALQCAAMGGFDHICRTLLSARADVEDPAGDAWGWRPICCAAELGRSNVIKVLVQFRADINVELPEDSNMNLASICARSSDIACLKFLLEIGVDVSGDRGNNALSFATDDRVVAALRAVIV